MATSNMATSNIDSLSITIGSGGAAGRALRIFLMFATGGFMFPNACVEGMNLTAIQLRQQGSLYDKDEAKPKK